MSCTQKEDTNGSLLCIDSGWYDIYLHRGRALPVPLIIKPNFVAEAIKFARSNQWKEGKIYIEYKEETFDIVKKTGIL